MTDGQLPDETDKTASGIERDRTCGHDDSEQDRIVTPDGEILGVCQECKWQREWDNRADQEVLEEFIDDQ